MDEPQRAELDRLKLVYFAAWPDGVERQAWKDITYVRVRPTWARYSDFRPSGKIVAADDGDSVSAHILLTPNLDEAIWSAELADGDAPATVYVVEPLGPIAPVLQQPDYQPPGHPSMSWCSREPLRVTGEVTEWLHYHGTRADLQPGDLIKLTGTDKALRIGAIG